MRAEVRRDDAAPVVGRGQLAGATVALMAMATAGIYLRLSAYQRENLLRAKELSASAVIRLFADSCAAAVVFDDPGELQNTLTILGRNEDIEYASVWAVDRTGAVTRSCRVAQGRPETVAMVPASIELRRDPDRVVPIAPVRDVNGRTIAVLVAAFSLKHENAAIVRLERTALLISTGVAAGLTMMLVAMARMVVVGRLAKLVAPPRGSARPRDRDRDRGVEYDEVGQLARAFRNMAKAIHVREERINTRNRDMRLVLDNVGQGFITLDVSGALSEERSRIVDEWFGTFAGSPTFWDYIRRSDPGFADYFEVGWSAVADQILPLRPLPRPATQHRAQQGAHVAARLSPDPPWRRLDKTVS